MMKTIIYIFSLFLSLIASNVIAQDQTPEKNVLTAETIIGKTFVSTEAQWGIYAIYFRPNNTFKVCGPITAGCDEGNWSFSEGKFVRVYKTWFAGVDHTIRVLLTQKGKKVAIGNLSADVFLQGESLPYWVYQDPRK